MVSHRHLSNVFWWSLLESTLPHARKPLSFYAHDHRLQQGHLESDVELSSKRTTHRRGRLINVYRSSKLL